MSDGMELTEQEYSLLQEMGLFLTRQGKNVRMRHLSTELEDIYDTVTPEEAEIIRQHRITRTAKTREFEALRSLLTTVRGQEKYQVECMIERRGGPVPTTCSCGAPRMSAAPLCYDCRDKAYG